MKRFLVLVLSIVLILSMGTGCSFEDDKSEKPTRGDVVVEHEGEFTITKMDVVAYASTSLAAMKREYIITAENDSVGFVIVADADMYIPCNIGDVIDGHFVATHANSAYFERESEFSDVKSTYMVLDYVILN